MSGAISPLPAFSLQGAERALVLASASPRREALLKQAGITQFRMVSPEIDETAIKRELPRTYGLRMAVAKAGSVLSTVSEGEEGGPLVLAADTVVALGRRILPKAEDDEEVERCLRLLSGRRHLVMTALALARRGAKLRTRIVTTRVAFKVLTLQEIARYVQTGEGHGKAGGYAIQGRADTFVRRITGSYSNVVGLPLYETVGLLTGAGWHYGS
jgi:septum formation protein